MKTEERERLIEYHTDRSIKAEYDDGHLTHRGLTCPVCEKQVVGLDLCFRCLLAIANELRRAGELREALEKIADYIGWQKRHVPEGHRLDAYWTVKASELPSTYISIARSALASEGGET